MNRISFLTLCFGLLAGEGSLMLPKSMEGTEIVDKRGAQLPLDTQLVDELGNPFRLGDRLKSGKPMVLTLGYYQCPMLCSLVLNALTDTMKGQSLKLGQDYSILSVSINPNEKPDLAQAKRLNYLKVVGAEEDVPWTFALGDESEVRKLAEAVGFGYKLHQPSGEFVHSAGIFIVSPEGILSRTFYGLSYEPSDFKMSLMDASHGKIGSLMDRVILSCFHYQPDSHKYGIYIFGVMRLAGALTVLILGTILFVFWKRERRLKTWTA